MIYVFSEEISVQQTEVFSMHFFMLLQGTGLNWCTSGITNLFEYRFLCTD